MRPVRGSVVARHWSLTTSWRSPSGTRRSRLTCRNMRRVLGVAMCWLSFTRRGLGSGWMTKSQARNVPEPAFARILHKRRGQAIVPTSRRPRRASVARSMALASVFATVSLDKALSTRRMWLVHFHSSRTFLVGKDMRLGVGSGQIAPPVGCRARGRSSKAALARSWVSDY